LSRENQENRKNSSYISLNKHSVSSVQLRYPTF
jgi:hypothetical protein